jgi:hypothetical protein
MPEELRERLADAAGRSQRSLNSEILRRLEESLDERPPRRRALARHLGAHTRSEGRDMHSRRRRRRLVAVAAVAVLAAVAVVAGHLANSSPSTAAPAAPGGELPPALAKKLAASAKFAPSVPMSLLSDNPTGWAEEDWLKHAYPGNTIPSAYLKQSRATFAGILERLGGIFGRWTPLGPTHGVGPFNPYRDRTVYNAGTPDFSGRIGHAAIDPNCNESRCRLWVANANGGVWLTQNALAPKPRWQFVSQGFGHQNTSAIEIDPNDKNANTVWVGTGELNACSSGCEAGVGLYRTRTGGLLWQGPFGEDVFNNRAIGSIAVKPGDPKTIFVGSGRAVRGVTSNLNSGAADSLIPGAPHFGLYRSQDGGKSWQLVSQGAPELCTNVPPDDYSLGALPCSPRGARRVMFDPVDTNVVYASFFARGIWRSLDGGDTWAQIMAPLGGGTNERAEFDVVELPDGKTRMYVGVGGGAGVPSQFRRNDDVRNPSAAAVLGGWLDLSSTNINNPQGYSSIGYCDPQCVYDNYVYVPPGAGPDVVYLSGDNEYSENDFLTGRSNGRGVLLSTDAGVSFTDMTDDDSDDVYPVELHPDHHALVTNPSNWRQFFDVGDGGIVRSNGNFVDDSGDCSDPSVPKQYTGARLAFCQLVLSRVPERLEAINDGLRTLHFYQLAYNPNAPQEIAGGTQDNGSWETDGDRDTWVNTNIADGGHNNFDVADPSFRMTAWQVGQIQINFNKLDQVGQTWISDTLWVIYGGEAVGFIAAAITDPVQAGWMWTGRQHVFRADNYGINPTFGKAKVLEDCNVWTGDFDLDDDGVYEPLVDICDSWKPLGNPGAAGQLTGATYGADRQGGIVNLVERTKADTSTLWTATSAGRIFVSKNADAADPADVVFNRIDNTSPAAPERWPSAIYVDPADGNHAWVVYSGFSAKTPATPGHVFEVRYDEATKKATFTSLDGFGPNGFGDIPALGVVVDGKGTVYVSTDYGVLALRKAQGWKNASPGLPRMAVPDLMYVPERNVIYAATHGQGVWQLDLR